jgi:hypothetical protein
LKVPTQLPPGVWTAQVQRYNNIPAGGHDRSFPCNMLVGAEKVLARVHHEHVTSKNYTPLALGEIISQRAYTADGDINKMANTSNSKKAWTMEDGTFTEAEPRPWDPQGAMQVIDALEAIRWAWILLEFGDETDIDNHISWFTKQIRTKRDKLPQIKRLWETAGWRQAVGMRNNRTFKDITTEMRQDAEWIQDIMQKHIGKSDGGKGRDTGRAASAGKGNGKDRAKSSGKNNSGGQGRPLSRQGSSDLCRRFNEGKCTNRDCKYDHRCGYCNKPGHGSFECHGNPANKGGKDRGRGRGKGDRSRSNRQGDQRPATTEDSR